MSDPIANAVEVARRSSAIVEESSSAIADAIDAVLFGGKPPSRVNTAALTRAVMRPLARAGDELMAADMAYVDSLRRAGRISPDAPSITPEVAQRIGKVAALEREVEANIERRGAMMDQMIFGEPIGDASTTRDWLNAAAFALSALGEQIEAGEKPEWHARWLGHLLFLVDGMVSASGHVAAPRLRALAERLPRTDD